MPFSASAVFCFTTSASAKCFPLRVFFFHLEKLVAGGLGGGRDRVYREGGAQRHAIFFGQKLLNTVQCGQVRW